MYIYIYRVELPKQNPVRTDDLAETILIKYMDTRYNFSSIIYVSLKSAVLHPNIRDTISEAILTSGRGNKSNTNISYNTFYFNI